ncbi:MAG TPA: alpha/beta hydrolase, partial [Candidatus Bathyarchaeia archaeon]|nr:alpha/beta hydrolase [Candidatus Bathyarchaeia archaeon]
MYVERDGDEGPPLLLVHGTFLVGWMSWGAQRPLAGQYRITVPHRSGYPPNPPVEAIDFDVQARELTELIEPGTHLVGHSYGGVVALLAAALVPDRVASLTVIEPPAFALVRGRPGVEELIGRVAEIQADREAPIRDRVVRFAAAVGSVPVIPDPLPST